MITKSKVADGADGPERWRSVGPVEEHEFQQQAVNRGLTRVLFTPPADLTQLLEFRTALAGGFRTKIKFRFFFSPKIRFSIWISLLKLQLGTVALCNVKCQRIRSPFPLGVCRAHMGHQVEMKPLRFPAVGLLLVCQPLSGPHGQQPARQHASPLWLAVLLMS